MKSSYFSTFRLSTFQLRFILVILAVLLFCGGPQPILAQPTWTHANSKGYYGATSGNAYTLSLGFTPAAGSLLVVGCAGNSTNTLSISDNSSGPADSWTAVVSATSWYSSSGSYRAEAWATNITSGTAPTSVTCTAGGTTTDMWITVDNYTGGPNPFVQDGSATTNKNTSTSKSAAGTQYTTGSVAGDLVWSFEAQAGTQSAVDTVASPFTMQITGASADYSPNTAADGVSGGVAASTGVTATYTLPTTAEYWVVFEVGFSSNRNASMSESNVASDALARSAAFGRAASEGTLTWGTMDAWLPCNTSSPGTTLTTTILGNCLVGGSGVTWSISSPATGMTIAASQGGLGATVTVNGTTYPASSVTQSISNDAYYVTNWTMTFPSGVDPPVVNVNGYVTFGVPNTSAASNEYGFGEFQDTASFYSLFQLWSYSQPAGCGGGTGYNVDIETDPSYVTTRSGCTAVTQGSRYAFSFQMNKTAQTSSLALYNPTTFAQVGSTVTSTLSGTATVQDYFYGQLTAVAPAAGYPSYVEDLMFDWSGHQSFPNVPRAVAASDALAASHGSTQPTFVQMNSSIGSSVAFSSNVTSGNALYAFVFCGAGATCPIAVSSTNETWPSPQATGALNTDHDSLAIACVTAAGTQADRVSATGNGSAANIAAVEIYEVSGATCNLDTTTSPGGGYVTTDSTQTTPVSSGSVTTTTNNDLMFMFAADPGGGANTTWTAGTGSSNLICVNNNGSGCTSGSADVFSGVEMQVLSTAGASSASINSSAGSSEEYGTIYAAFKAAVTSHAYTATLGEGNIASDAVMRLVSFGRAGSETNTASDAIARNVSFGRGDSESNTASDLVARTAVFGRSASVSDTVSDSIARLAVYGRGDSESNIASDAIARNAGFGRSGSESNTASDAMARLAVYGRADGETNPSADGLARSVSFGRAGSESNIASDILASLEQMPGGFSAALYEANIASDAIARLVVYGRGASEANIASDAVVRSHGLSRADSESNTTSDTVARMGTFGRGESETNPSADGLGRTSAALRSDAEMLASSDAVIVLRQGKLVILPRHAFAAPGQEKAGSEPGRVKGGAAPPH